MGEPAVFQFISEEPTPKRRSSRANLKIIRSHITKQNAVKRHHRNNLASRAWGEDRTIVKKGKQSTLEELLEDDESGQAVGKSSGHGDEPEHDNFLSENDDQSAIVKIEADPTYQLQSQDVWSPRRNRAPPAKQHGFRLDSAKHKEEIDIAIAVPSTETKSRGELRSDPLINRAFGAGRFDPFNVYPINGERYVHELIDYCKLTLNKTFHTPMRDPA